ncbi:uncharacterized protein [Dermacentor andersoni]|uniref:uncharacterized protein n=1 Tax=Dermacentor andersoni TaxID=34620 RepID=UPI00241750DD|nr:uncharacterized protein LOC129382260 [Dermacentor andersoni]
MNREKGDIGGESLSSSPQSSGPSGGAPPTLQAPTPAPRRSFSYKKKDFDVRRAVVTWFSEQLKHAQPWKQFADTTKFSMPSSTLEVADRIRSNVGRFLINYGALFIVILVGQVVSSLKLVGYFTVACAVFVALKLHRDDETAAVCGLVLDKNERLGVAAPVALLLLYTSGIWSAVVWSFRATVVVGAVHATLYAGPPNKFDETLPDIPEKGDNTNSP